MLRRGLTKAGAALVSRAAPRAIAGRAHFATAGLVDLDEEFPGLPPLSPGSPSPLKVESTTLPTGVKVVSTEAGKVTSVGLSVAAGSQFETAEEYGAAHTLQHLAFKASTSKSALRTLRDLESVGSTPSSYAGRDAIVYKVTALPENAEAGLASAFESALSPKITPHAVHELEESIIAYELQQVAADGKKQLIEAMYEAAYGEYTPLGHTFFSKGHVDPATLLGFRTRTFVGSGLTVVGTGVAHAQLVSWASSLAEAVPKGSVAAPASPFAAGEARVKATSELTYVGLGFAAPPKADAAALAVLTRIWDAALPAGASSFVLPGLVGVMGVAPAASAGKLAEGLLQATKSATASNFAGAKAAAAVSSLAKLDASPFEVLASGGAPSGIEGVKETDVSGLLGKIWKSGVSLASVGNLSTVPKLSSIAK